MRWQTPNDGATSLVSADTILAYASAVLACTLGLGALFLGRRIAAHWAFAAGMLFVAAERTCIGLAAGAPSPVEIFHWQIRALAAASFLPGIWLFFSLSYARGNAREFLAKWRYVLLGAFLLPVGAALLFRAELLASTFLVPGQSYLVFRLGPAGTLLYVMQLVGAVLLLMNLERTFRASVGTVRWRIKFILMGVGLLFIVRLYTVSQALLFRVVDPSLDSLNSGTLLVASLLIVRSLLRVANVGLDVYPSHSLLKGSVTILLAGIYLLIVGIFAKFVSYLGGSSAFGLQALLVLVLLVLLAVLLQSDRVRMQLQRFVSRHFQRPLYDYRTVWRNFAEATSSRVDQTDYTRAVVKLLTDTLQTLSVTFWLVADHREQLVLVASTSLSDKQAEMVKPSGPETAAIIRHLQANPDPVDIEDLKDEWAAALRRGHPDEFHKGGTRVCVPVISRGELLGLIILGDRVGGAAFAPQDFDLLKSVGDEISSGLLNVRLSQRLLRAREHEAFQTMATFFVHDLKNAASTLNLMLQNLPEHFDDPAFRQDALRGVAASVAHINHLISRLGQLRQEMKIQAVDSDLNEIVSAALAPFKADAGFLIEQDLGPVPRLPLDHPQLTSVVANLVLNAREAAAAPGGRLRLITGQMGAWAVLTATDNGCGMSAEFVARSLFRPFQTTKKNGLGIGMFQSKMIVEAHGGRIAVESTAGQGTTFRIFLPLPIPHS